jgi:putative DNA primase/helicase
MPDWKTVASQLWEYGYNVFPCNALKKPIIEHWKQWQTNRQTREEFETLDWSTGYIAIVDGTLMPNGEYSFTIDVDCKHGKNTDFDCNKSKPLTWTERTVNNGYHFRVTGPEAESDFAFKPDGFELRGKGEYTLVAPSQNYQEIRNWLIPTSVKDVNTYFRQFIEHLKTHSTAVANLLKGQLEGHRNASGLKIASLYRIVGYDKYETLDKMQLWNQRNAPPLSNDELKTTVESAFDKTSPYYKSYQKYVGTIFAEMLLDEYHFKTTRDNETVYVYDTLTGIYRPGEPFIKERMAEVCRDKNKLFYLGDCLHHIKGRTFFDRLKTPDPDTIVVQNGILNIKTKKLTPYTPDIFNLEALQVKYDPDTQCLKILKFLEEVIGKNQLEPLQEIIGFNLYRDYIFHIAILLIGEGENGKSTLLNLITTFLGKENVTGESLQALCFDKFSKAQLYGKLANICADIPATPITQTSNFKMLTGNDQISGQHKFKDSFTFHNYAKLWFSCNRIPPTSDDTDAFFRRWKLITCNNMFTKEKRNANILNEITTPEEMSGLLNWALTGLERLLKTRDFTQSETTEKKREEYMRKSNSAKAFVEECLENDTDPEHTITKDSLYRIYINYCLKNSLPTTTKAQLTQNINQYASYAEETHIREGITTERAWRHLKLGATQ